jgi:hypothetical protein
LSLLNFERRNSQSSGKSLNSPSSSIKVKRELFGEGKVTSGFHGDPKMHKFHLVPTSTIIEKPYETHDPRTFCDNYKRLNPVTFECQGHGIYNKKVKNI